MIASWEYPRPLSGVIWRLKCWISQSCQPSGTSNRVGSDNDLGAELAWGHKGKATVPGSVTIARWFHPSAGIQTPSPAVRWNAAASSMRTCAVPVRTQISSGRRGCPVESDRAARNRRRVARVDGGWGCRHQALNNTAACAHDRGLGCPNTSGGGPLPCRRGGLVTTVAIGRGCRSACRRPHAGSPCAR